MTVGGRPVDPERPDLIATDRSLHAYPLQSGPRRTAHALLWLAVLMLAMLTGRAHAQGIDPEGRPIRQVVIEGLDQIEQRLIDNSIRSTIGQPYQKETAEQDVVRITNLGYFSSVTALVKEDHGGVILTYQLVELPILTAVEFRGNRANALDDLTLRGLTLLRSGDAVDPFLIDRAKRAIVSAYEEKGYFVADVSIDQQALDQQRKLVFIIREGPRIRLRDIRFEGNAIIPAKALRKQVRSKVWSWPFSTGGVVDREQLKLDAAAIRDYYQQRGYLEAEVDRQITVAANQHDALATFIVTEGPRWTVGEVQVESVNGGPLLFSEQQIIMNMALLPGDIYSASDLRQSILQINELYGRLGYLNTRLIRLSDGQPGIDRVFNPETNTVDLRVRIDEGTPTLVGKVTVRGNSLTRTKVVLRETRGMLPGRPFDRTGLDESRRRLSESVLFRDPTITLLGEDDDPERDVLVEVAERNTGSISFGATVSSDDGLLGAVDITQRNFDVTDLPESWDDFLANRAFRGGGQTFNLTLSPGSENSRYSVSLSDPYFLDSNYFADTELFFYDSQRDGYDERRSGARLGLGKRFGDVWSASVRARAENVRADDLEVDAPLDVYAVEGTNLVTGLSFRVTRNTTDSALSPTRGSKTTLSIERVGALGGDYDFTKALFSYDKFWTVGQDILDRKSVLRFRIDTGYIFEENESPIFERFLAGGHSTFRGFANRGIGPRGIRADTLTLGEDAVGGDFLLLTGLQYEFPLVDNYLRGVIFTDQGTLRNDPSFKEWRVSIGTGIRLQVPFLSQAPFALDFAIPLVSEDTDDERLISFALDIPFQ